MPRVICIARDGKHLVAGLFKSARLGELVLDAVAVEDESKAESIERIYEELGGQSVRVAMSAHETLIKTVRTVKVKPSEWARVAEFEASQVIPGSLEETTWDWRARETAGELELLFAAAKAATIARWCGVIEPRGPRIESMTPLAVATVNAFRHNYPEEQAGVWLICCCERSAQLIWIDGGSLYFRNLPGTTISIGEDTSRENAKRLAGEIARTTLLEGFPGKMQSARKLFLAGAPGESSDFVRELEDGLSLPVERLNPLRKVKSKVDVSEIAREHETALFGLVGLAVQDTATALRLNLLPKERRNLSSLRRKQAWLAAAAALVVIAGAVPVAARFMEVRDLEGRKQTLEASLVPLRSLEKRYAREAGILTEVQKAQTAWKNWIKQKGAWSGFLAELQECLWRTEDAWLDGLQVRRVATQGRTVIQVELKGRWINATRPLTKNATAGRERMGLLFEELALCKGVVAVEDERFEAGGNGVLNFSCRILMEEGEMI